MSRNNTNSKMGFGLWLLLAAVFVLLFAVLQSGTGWLFELGESFK